MGADQETHGFIISVMGVKDFTTLTKGKVTEEKGIREIDRKGRVL